MPIQKILKPIVMNNSLIGNMGCLIGILQPGNLPLPTKTWVLQGVSRDKNGSILPNCTMLLFRASDNKFIDSQISDGSGNYSFTTVGPAENYFVNEYLAGSPDVAGTTVNTLIGI